MLKIPAIPKLRRQWSKPKLFEGKRILCVQKVLTCHQSIRLLNVVVVGVGVGVKRKVVRAIDVDFQLFVLCVFCAVV
jgi:hypothetical protein